MKECKEEVGYKGKTERSTKKGIKECMENMHRKTEVMKRK
jgi:hypothetical protein